MWSSTRRAATFPIIPCFEADLEVVILPPHLLFPVFVGNSEQQTCSGTGAPRHSLMRNLLEGKLLFFMIAEESGLQWRLTFHLLPVDWNRRKTFAHVFLFDFLHVSPAQRYVFPAAVIELLDRTGFQV